MYGLMKIPAPMMPPTTTMVASNGPRARFKLMAADAITGPARARTSDDAPALASVGQQEWIGLSAMLAPLPTRRDFLKISSLTLAGWALPGFGGWRTQRVRFGMLADPHYADSDARGTRFYRESVAKVRECVDCMNAEQVEFLIELGDFKDQDEPPVEADTLRYLETIEAELQRFSGPAYHVLGNHDMDSISKPQFLAAIDNPGVAADASYYAFDRGGLHNVVLDASFRADGATPTSRRRSSTGWRRTSPPTPSCRRSSSATSGSTARATSSSTTPTRCACCCVGAATSSPPSTVTTMTAPTARSTASTTTRCAPWSRARAPTTTATPSWRSTRTASR
jgi:hypothetical protein